MKVGIAAPLTVAAVNGGVRTQIMQTTHHLRLLGIDVEFIHFDQQHFDYDLIHIFVANSETISIAKQVVAAGIKLVVSPVFFSNRNSSVISTSLMIEKSISVLESGIRSDFGIKSEICKYADVIVPNTNSELELIRDGLKVHKDKLQIIPNGVESRFQDARAHQFKETFGIKDFVLFVGQAGAPRKNVINLLRAAAKIETPIVIIGDFYENEYSKQCLKIANSLSNVMLVNSLEHDDPLLESAYAACKVFCLPSLYETPSIAALEAGLAGANIVITKHGGTQEYFENYGLFVDPTSVKSITNVINNSLQLDRSPDLKKKILTKYTWEIVGRETRNVYSSLF